RYWTLSGCGLDSYPGIDDSATLARRQRKDWVQVNFGYFGYLFNQARNTQQYVFECSHVRRRVATITLEEPVAANRMYHLAGVAVGQRRHAETNITQDFDVNAA